MKQHIMLIDSNRDELKTFMSALDGASPADGFKCTYSDNMRQALLMLDYLVPHYIFVELNMPVLSGLDFLAITRSESRLQRTKIYLYSKDMSPEIVSRAYLLGASGCVSKNTAAILAEEMGALLDTSREPSYVFYGGN